MTKPRPHLPAGLTDRFERTLSDVRDAVARIAQKSAEPSPRPAPAPRPVQPAAVALHSFGLSTAPTFGPTDAQRRAKADADALQARRDALPATVTTWANRLTLVEQEALAVVGRLHAANGKQPVPIQRAELGTYLGVSPEDAEGLLNKLAEKGAVRRNLRFHSAPRYVPVEAPPEPSRALKTDGGRPADPSALPRLRSAVGLRGR